MFSILLVLVHIIHWRSIAAGEIAFHIPLPLAGSTKLMIWLDYMTFKRIV